MSAKRSRSAATAGARVPLFRRTPSLVLRPAKLSRSACQRSKLMMAGVSPGTGSPSDTLVPLSSGGRPSSISGIDLLLEGAGADAADGVEEAFAIGTVGEVDLDHGVDGIDSFFFRDRRADDVADGGGQGRVAADGDLVAFLTALIDTQDADVADMVMA